MTTPHLTDLIATELRIGVRVLQETWGGLRRTGWMNAVIIVTMASILSIFGILFAFVLETQLFIDNIGSGLKISVYTQAQADVGDVTRQIQQLPHVKGFKVIPKETAWADMKKNYQVPNIANPLPDTIHVQMDDQNYIEPTVAKIKALPGVETVNYARNFLVKLQQIARATSVVGLAVSVFFGTLTLFIISNTIHLLIQARGREIEIMRMMGVGNWYIRCPFLFQGAVYGLIGAFIASLPLNVAEYWVNELFQSFQFSTSGYSHSLVLGIIILMGILVGGGGAGLSVHKYLKV